MGVSQAYSTGLESRDSPGKPADEGLSGEAALVERCRNDRGAFAAVYRAHYAAIAGYLFRRTGDRHAAEDLAAETFIAAMGSIDQYRVDKTPMRSWLYRIATNQANRWARRRRRELLRVGSHSPGESRAPSEVAGEAEELARARGAMLRLRDSQQAVLALHYFEGLSVAEIATTLDWREGTVKSILSRAREALRRELRVGEAISRSAS